MVDSKSRSFLKAITWRIFAVILLMLVSFALTRSIKTVTYITLLYHSIQIFMFYLHEQLWNYIKWGKTRGLFVQMTGLSGAGKTTLAQALAEKLRKQGYKIEIIDGDEYREGICKDLGFSKQDRCTNIRRLGFVGKVLARNNVIAIMSAINPYDEVRNELTSMGEFVRTVHIKCDIETLKKRDTKGLYARALLPDGDPNKVHNFTGISDPFEEPTSADLTIETNKEEMEASLKKLHEFVLREAGSK